MEDEGFASSDTSGRGRGGGPLPEVVAELFEQRLDRSRPLWRIDLVPPRRRQARAGVADPSRAGRRPDLHAAGRRGAVGLRSRVAPASAATTTSAGARTWPGSCGASSCSGTARSPFDGTIGARRRVAFAAVPLHELHDAAKELAGATLNDAVARGHRGGAAPLDRCAPRTPRGAAGAGAGEPAPAGRGRRQPRLLLLRLAAAAPRPTRWPGCGPRTPRRRCARPSTTPRRWTSCCASWRGSPRACSACASASRRGRGSSP